MSDAIPQQIRVLLVEDEEALRLLLTKVLQQSGLHIISADSAEQALILWQEQEGKIDVLVTDLIMDGINGFELAERLQEKNGDLPVICMTGYGLDMLETQLARHPDFIILQKPFRPRDLADQIRGLLFPSHS